MIRSFTSIFSGFCLVLTACQPVRPGEAAAFGQGSGAAREAVSSAGLLTIPDCASSMSSTLSDGPQIQYLGSDPEDPQRCLLQWANRSHPLYFGFWSADPRMPLTDEARTAMRTVLTGPVGTEASFETQRARLWSRVTLTHVANNTVDVAGAKRPALELRAVRHDAHGRPDVRAETRYTIDRATGVLLRRESVTPMANGQVDRTTSWQVNALGEAG